MKKFLSLLTLMLLCTTAWAETVTDTLTVTGTGIDLNSSSYQDWSGMTFASDAVYAGNSARGASATNLSIQLRSKNSNSGIVTTASGGATVKKVTITFNSSTTSGNVVQVFGKAAAYNSAADLYGDNKGTLVGEITCGTNTDLTFSSSDIYPYIGLRSKSGAIYIDQIEIVWDTEASTATVAAPVITFSPATAYEGDEVTCSISCATDGAVIQYSTDGETYQEYNGEFTLNATTTVYAKATLNNEVSEIAQKTITFGKVVQNIADFNALEDNETFKFNGTVTVLGQKGSNLYVQDANNGMLIYGTTNQEYTFGDIIPAGFKGTKTTFSGAPEMKDPTGFAAATENVEPTAIEMTIADVTLENFGRYGVIRGATINGDSIVVGNAKVAYFNRFEGVAIPTDDATYDVYGVASYHNGNQFLPLSFKKVETPVEFGIQVSPVAGEYTEPVTVEISTTGLAEGEVATITYTIGDGEEQTYTEPFTLYKSATVTVMAECGEKSDIQEYTYTINLPALAFTMTPEPGTYQGEQNVTIACTNAVSDLTVVWAYTPEEGDTIEGDETSMTFTAAKSGVLTIMAEEANTGREYNTPEEGLTYTITEPIELDGMIVFADNEADGSPLDSDGIIGQATKGGNYIESASDIDKVYAGAEGLKFSNSSTNGTMTLNLKDKWNATKISFIAKAWTSSTTGKTDAAKMTVNGNEFDLTKDFALYEFVPESQVEAITFAATKRAYLKVINIEGETVTPQPSYDIVVTPTPEEGKVYKSGITVKAEVTPELPEGASLKYVFVETGATEEAVENDYTDAGVKLSKSGTLTFIARDAANAELARKSVDYTFSLVGDLNGDGIVDVSDVQYLVNIILGKVNFDE
ncbi:MAG: chitobiase/beta-hexosaminidase C-terminal domain-containing protein [Muribaculaceae bacterium]|nr:chitobiase/beta-hexosaminidase C-terminal domain-containing protein [Muribaculaceae bacterium]